MLKAGLPERTLQKKAVTKKTSQVVYQGDELVKKVQTKSGKVQVDLGGKSDDFVNVNSCIDGQEPSSIPNLINGSAENVASYFKPGSVDFIRAENIIAGHMDWDRIAKGSYEVLKKGGSVAFAEFGGGATSGANIKKALIAAGFKNVEILGGVVVTGIK